MAAWWCGGGDPEDEEAFEKALLQEGYAVLPNDGRCITSPGWGRFSPIIVTVRNGFVEGVTGVPEEVTVEVQDWDNGELDAAGQPVPTVSEWPALAKDRAAPKYREGAPLTNPGGGSPPLFPFFLTP